MKKFFTVLSFLLLAASPSQAKVIGFDDLIPSNGGAFNIPYPIRMAVDTVGLMSMGCTGTHIGSNLVISAAHCFLGLPLPAGRTLTNLTCPTNMTIQWGVRGDRRGMISKCTRVVALQFTMDTDWVVFEVDRAPRGYSIVNNQDVLRPQQTLTILSHPEALPLQWSQRCRLLPGLSNRIGPKFMHHQCDTKPGSSGAPIYDLNSMAVVAIHNGGSDVMNYGTPLTSLPWDQIIAAARIRRPLQPLPGSVF